MSTEAPPGVRRADTGGGTDRWMEHGQYPYSHTPWSAATAPRERLSGHGVHGPRITAAERYATEGKGEVSMHEHDSAPHGTGTPPAIMTGFTP